MKSSPHSFDNLVRIGPREAVGGGPEVRPGCLKVAAYAESKRLADALADWLSDGDF